MEIRLLGPVQVRREDGWIIGGSPRQCGVLAVLALAAGQPVPVETLLTRVWDDHPPGRPRDSLYVYIARLRRRLAAGSGPVQPVRRPGGYALEVATDQVDAHRFRALVEQGRTLGPAEADRLRSFESALALWRGVPLSNVPGQWAAGVRQSWSQQRLDAVVDWARCHLSRGTPQAVIGTLGELAVEHPLAEPLAAVLMRALAATGQGSAALDHYAALRRRLAEELGADPGAELAQVHRAILRGEAGDPVPAPRPTSRAPDRPAQLPPDRQGFSGRVAELARLDRLLAGSGRRPTALVISAVSGGAGVGKTALAIHWSHRVADRFPDGQLYLNLRGFHPSAPPVDPTEALGLLLDALGVAPQAIPGSRQGRVGRYRSLLSGKRMLVLLDNARDAEQVRPLLPGSPGNLVLVTSRDRLSGLVAGDGAEPITVDVFTPDEAHTFLTDRLGKDRVAVEPASVTEIIARCGRLPLALAIVAARAVADPHLPLEELADGLRREPGLAPFEGSGDDATELRSVFAGSYHALGEPARRMFRLLGLHTGTGITIAAAASLAGTPPEHTRRPLSELVRAHLLLDRAAGRYTLHDLLRAYAAELAGTADPAPEREAAQRRLLDHYRFTAHTAALIVNPTRERIRLPPRTPGVTSIDLAGMAQALAWFDAERPGLVGAIHAYRTGLDIWQLSWALRDYLDLRSEWPALLATQRIALDSATRADDPAGRSDAHGGVALAHTRMGDLADARAQLAQALELQVRLNNPPRQARIHCNLGYLQELEGRYPEALGHARRAATLRVGTAEPPGRDARLLNMIGWLLALNGRFGEGLRYCEQALRRNRQIGDRRSEGQTLDSLGYIYHHLGDYARSAACYRDALRIFRELGDRRPALVTYDRWRQAAPAAGDLPEARQAWQEAEQILADLGIPHHGSEPGPLIP